MSHPPRRGQRDREGYCPSPPSPAYPHGNNHRYTDIMDDDDAFNFDSTNTQQPNGQSPAPMQRSQQQQRQNQQQIATLLEYAQTSYTSRPADALSALMDALTLQSGPDATQQAMDRIRNELGEVVADHVSGNSSHQLARHHHLSEAEMTQRAMAVVQELLHDESTFLYAQGKQHILQQAMEDGSSVVCTKCGDMIKAERWSQHAEYWCRGIGDAGDEGKDMS